MVSATDVPQNDRPSLLRPAVTVGPEQLSAAARKRVQALVGPRPARFWRELALAWLAIAIIVTVGLLAHHIFVTALCIVLVSTRQLILGLLMHEQVHRLGGRMKYSDWVINLLAVYPLLITTVEDYAKVHLSHHKYFMTEQDPDFLRKAGQEWTFPARFRTVMGIVLRDITGLSTVKLIRGKTAPRGLTEFERRHPTPRWLRLVFFAVLAAVLTVVGGWTAFLVYWILPLLTTTQLFIRWIAVVEHMYNIENARVHDVTPLVELTWWQKILFPDLNFAMHVYHHMHPGVSFSLLPEVHRIYRDEGFVDQSAVFRGQGSFLRYLVKRRT